MPSIIANQKHQSGRGKGGRIEAEKTGGTQGSTDEHVEKGKETTQETIAIGQRVAGNES